MIDQHKRYRRVSVTQEDGREGKYDARVDMEIDRTSGIVTYKVYSQVLVDKVITFRSLGNTVEDSIHLEEVCQRVYDFDRNYRVRPVPKPERSSPKAAVEPQRCPMCGGDGWSEDEEGYPVMCECRA